MKVFFIFIDVVLIGVLWYCYCRYKTNFQGGLSTLSINVDNVSQQEAKISNPRIYTNKNKEITMENLIYFGKENTFPDGIPRIVHYNFKHGSLPSQYIHLVNKCVRINPTVLFAFWTDAAAIDLFKTHYSENLEMLKRSLLKNQVLKKPDIIRYFILYHFGGIYIDLDTLCQRPFDKVMLNESCFLSRESEVQTMILWNKKYLAVNNLMACVADHHFFKDVVVSLQKNNHSLMSGRTGPFFLTKLYKNYHRKVDATKLNDKKVYIVLSPLSLFASYVLSDLEKQCTLKLLVWQSRGCKNLPFYRKEERQLLDQAATVHLFNRIGNELQKHFIESRTDIRTVKYVYTVVHVPS